MHIKSNIFLRIRILARIGIFFINLAAPNKEFNNVNLLSKLFGRNLFPRKYAHLLYFRDKKSFFSASDNFHQISFLILTLLKNLISKARLLHHAVGGFMIFGASDNPLNFHAMI